MQDQFVEKSAFEDNEDEDEVNNTAATSQFVEESKKTESNSQSTKKRTLSDVAAEKGGTGTGTSSSQATRTTGTSDGSSN